MRSKAFTLIELLAVIVILAIILAIAIPSISGIVNSVTRNAFEDDAKMVLKQLDYELLQNSGFDVTSVTEENIDDLKLSNANYEGLSVSIVDTKPYILIVGKNKWDGLKACGTIRNMNVVQASDEETCFVSEYITSEGVNKPRLATRMIPVKWVTDHWVTTTEDDDDWYQYGETPSTRNWANVIQVSNPSSYTESGTTVDVVNDVIAMWVWIPRYIYNISDGWHEQMTSTTGGTIEVQFSMDTDDTRDGTVTLVNTGNASDSDGTWTSHPAFKFGDDQLTGIWVAKFESSGTTSAIDSKPNVLPILSTTVGDVFTATRGMETNTRYGWGDSGTNLDTHLMKNTEWGAVAYLTQSSYGINGNIGINNYNNSGFRTGCGAAPGSSVSTTCNTYDTTGVIASTTGNIYGIYDMSGGAYEYVAGYINNSYADDYGASLVSDNAKYKDVYTPSTADTEEDWYNAHIDNYALSINRKGDAVYETSYSLEDRDWYDDIAYMPETSGPWFVRGGNFAYNSTAGVFNFNGDDGYAYDTYSFRPVVLVGTGL